MNHSEREVTWELEDEMREKFPSLTHVCSPYAFYEEHPFIYLM